VLKESSNEFDGGKCDVASLLGFVVAVAESDVAVLERLQAVVGNRDAVDVSGEIFQNLFTATCMLTVNDPVFLPE
jgi:hypothetical protein